MGEVEGEGEGEKEGVLGSIAELIFRTPVYLPMLYLIDP